MCNPVPAGSSPLIRPLPVVVASRIFTRRAVNSLESNRLGTRSPALRNGWCSLLRQLTRSPSNLPLAKPSPHHDASAAHPKQRLDRAVIALRYHQFQQFVQRKTPPPGTTFNVSPNRLEFPDPRGPGPVVRQVPTTTSESPTYPILHATFVFEMTYFRHDLSRKVLHFSHIRNFTTLFESKA